VQSRPILPSSRASTRRTSCGVLVTLDGTALLIGRFTGLTLWDIPKGLADPGEAFDAAAARELAEETGLEAPVAALRPLGTHRYRPGKDLALFVWPVTAMPDPEALRCRSMFRARDGSWQPELDAFAVLPWEAALARLGRNMQRVLTEVRAGPGWPFRG
jgi:8-oxo-dGTP pyrophosphatase MutT (NUDIX family)